MLRPDPQRKTLGFQRPALRSEEPVDVVRRVARGQDDLRRLVNRTACAQHFPTMLAPVRNGLQIHHFLVEMILPTVLLDAVPDALHDARERVTADVRMRVDQDALLRTEGHQLVQDLADVAALVGTRIEFAVRESAGATFAEAVVRIGIDPLLAVERSHIHFPLVYVLAPLQDHGPQPFHQQAQCRKHSGGAAAHHDDGLCVRNVLVGRKLKAIQRLPLRCGLHPVAVEDLTARIERTPHDADLRHPFGLGAERTCGRLPQLRFGGRVPNGKRDFEGFHRQSPYSAARERGAMSSVANCPARYL